MVEIVKAQVDVQITGADKIRRAADQMGKIAIRWHDLALEMATLASIVDEKGADNG